MEKELRQKIEECKAKILANSKDAHFAETLIDSLMGLQKQADVEAVELIVPTKEVVGEVDLGSIRLVKTIRGYMFEAKGGLRTFVDLRLQSLYNLCEDVYKFLKNETEPTSDEVREYQATLADALMTAFQAPLFGSLSTDILLAIGATTLKEFKGYAQGLLETPLREETEEDVKADAEAEKIQAGLEIIANSAPKE